jgi:hypothetical protein
VKAARTVVGLVLAVAVLVAAVRVNAAVHGIGYHWLPDRSGASLPTTPCTGGRAGRSGPGAASR